MEVNYALTDTLMHHVHLKREVLLADAMFRRGMEMELLESELLAGESRGTVGDNLERRAQILKLELLLGNIDDRDFRCNVDSVVCRPSQLY